MTVKAAALPAMPTVLGAMDDVAKRTAGKARDNTVAAARRFLPARSGRARRGTIGRVTRTPLGYVVTVAPTSRVRYPNGVTAVQVVGWVEGGTGVYGPRRRPIRPRKEGGAFKLPSGFRSGELRGQRAQRPIARARSSEEARTERMYIDAAQEAARAAERVLAGGRR